MKETKIADSVLLNLFICSNVMRLAPVSAGLYFQTD